MKIFICIVIILIVLSIVVVQSKVKINMHFQHYDKNDQFTIVIKALYGLITKKINIPVIKVGDPDSAVDIQIKSKKSNIPKAEKKKITFHDVFESIGDTRKFIRSVIDAKPILKHYVKDIEVQEFTWNSSIGLSDAAFTGKVAGIAWGMIGFVEKCMYAYFTVKCQPSITLTPYFNHKIIQTNINCIVSISVGKTMITAVKLFFHYKRKGFRFSSFTKNESV